MNKVSKVLFSLSEVDKEIQDLIDRRAESEAKCAQLEDDLQRVRQKFTEVEEVHSEAVSRRGIEEHRLKEEENKIVERRKQLTALGGAKSAKLVERELDIATRVIETLERAVEEASEKADRLDAEKEVLADRLHNLQTQFDSETSEAETIYKDIDKELKKLEKQRDTSYGKIEDRLKNLYRKVNTRYPGEAVAVAKSGSCRSCFRALPAQTYNQVMAGNLLIQCPGCARIMVFAEAS